MSVGALLVVAAMRPREPVALAETGVAARIDILRSAIVEEDEANDVFPSGEQSTDRSMAVPTGEPTALGCDDARTIVAQARNNLAAPPGPIDAAKFAAGAVDWLDPHGLWSVAPDAPLGAAIRKNADKLIAELEGAPGAGTCSVAKGLGAELAAWSVEVRAAFDQGVEEGKKQPAARDKAAAFQLATSTPFEEGTVTKRARDLAKELGRQVGVLESAYGDSVAPFAEAARNRAAPSLDAEAWAKVVTAAAVRAYIPQLDAHGAWAPLEEEISIYDLSLEADPPARLWTERTRTVLGIRIEKGAQPPLLDGDIVVRVLDVPLAGMSVEQSEQLGVLSDARETAGTRVTVLRAREPAPLELEVTVSRGVAAGSASAGADEPVKGDTSAAPPFQNPALDVDLLRYGKGRVAIIPIHDVPDDLGDRLSSALDRARAAGDLEGVVLDLRANGGGSTDGAIAALGLFMPGVSLFPMRRRDGGMEIERAPEVSPERRYAGPLAVLVDGDSASAAEMMAGGLASYHRAVVIGDKTYGKGCAQEYLDDDAHAGVLRLTTLLFSLPDGSPVQKTGILPNVRLSLPATPEREALLTRALGPWRGPDVRDLSQVRDVPWPNTGGRIGPCRDATVCRALRALGASPAAAR